ncbi:MAG: alpha/beta hydrolase, partial [Calditrichaceae bacterium]
MKAIHISILIFFFLLASNAISQQDSIVTGYIDVNDGKLYYEMTGNGDETIVLIHDGLVHHAIWDSQFVAFAKNFKVVRYDRRGYGMS